MLPIAETWLCHGRFSFSTWYWFAFPEVRIASRYAFRRAGTAAENVSLTTSYAKILNGLQVELP